MSRTLRIASVASRVALGLVFLFAAATKVPSLAAFAEDVANYRLLPASAVPALAVATVGVEVVAAAALLARFWVRAAALVCGGLLAAFTVALSQALIRGIDLRCGCFGGSELASWGAVARDVALLVPAVVIFVAEGQRRVAGAE